MNNDILIKHGIDTIEVIRTFDGIKKYLEENYIEGIVFQGYRFPSISWGFFAMGKCDSIKHFKKNLRRKPALKIL